MTGLFQLQAQMCMSGMMTFPYNVMEQKNSDEALERPTTHHSNKTLSLSEFFCIAVVSPTWTPPMTCLLTFLLNACKSFLMIARGRPDEEITRITGTIEHYGCLLWLS